MNRSKIILISLALLIIAGLGYTSYFLYQKNSADTQANPTSTPTTTPTSTNTTQPSSQSPAPSQSPEVKAPDVREFTISASQWSFSPSQITVNKGDTVKLTVTSTDVAHGIAIKDFGVSVIIPAGTTKTVEFVADKAGTFKFSCSVQCGRGHGKMTGTLIVQ